MITKNSDTHEDIRYPHKDESLKNRILAELDRFLSYIFEGSSLSFADFLDSSGEYFDKYVIETRKKEQLNFVGGKLILTPEAISRRVTSANADKLNRGASKSLSVPCSVNVTVNLYFQDKKKEWVMKTVQKSMTSDSIQDWDTAPELEELRAGNTIEFPIDPPIE